MLVKVHKHVGSQYNRMKLLVMTSIIELWKYYSIRNWLYMTSGCLKTVMAERERRRTQLVCIRVTIFQDLSKLTQDNGSSSLYPSSHSVSKCPFVFILVFSC